MNIAHPWFALQTKPRNERTTEYLLQQKGYESFTPTYRLKRKWSDRSVNIDFPLFPGYVFCRFNPSALDKAISTRGVTRIVGFGGKPAEVDVEEVKALRRLTESNLLREPWKYLPDGVTVLVETGPLAGVKGIIRANESQKQLIISVTLLQRSVAIQLTEETVISVITDLRRDKSGFSDEEHLAIKLLSS